MKEKVMALWAKVVENKQIVIKVGGAVAGAVLGAVVAAVIADAQEEYKLTSEDLIDFSDEQTEE